MTQHSQNGEGVEVLLPCPNPWCDSEASPFVYRVVSHRAEWAVSCGCGFLGPVLDDKERAIIAWNTRQSLAREPATADVGREAIALIRDWRKLVRLENVKARAGTDLPRDAIDMFQADMYTRWPAWRVDEIIAAISRAAPSSERVDQWEPIASAPMDRTIIMVLVPLREGGFVQGRAYYDADTYGGAWWWDGTSADDYFTDPISECNHGDPLYWLKDSEGEIASSIAFINDNPVSTAASRAALSTSSEPAIAEGELAGIIACMDEMLADPKLDALAFDKHDSRIIRAALAALPSKDATIAEAVERMRADPFIDDAHLLGTTSQDQRMQHYAAIALATTPPTTNDAIPAGMVRWDGGDSAPDDWDGGMVALDNGAIGMLAATVGWSRRPTGNKAHIIAYRPKTQPDEPLYRKLGQITDEQRADIRRIITGEADEDRIRRGDVHAAIRSLRTNPVPSREYQRALGDVGKRVTALSAAPSAPATEAGEGA